MLFLLDIYVNWIILISYIDVVFSGKEIFSIDPDNRGMRGSFFLFFRNQIVLFILIDIYFYIILVAWSISTLRYFIRFTHFWRVINLFDSKCSSLWKTTEHRRWRQQQQQQHSLLSQTSWGRLEMKSKRHKGHGSGTLIASLQALLSKATSSEIF